MTRLHLVRHGKATGGWDTDPDPGLDRIGHEQAAEACDRLVPLGPLPIVCSPLRRCRETAAPLAAAWGVTPDVRPAVAEIPTPEGMVMGERTPWLRRAMQGTWADLGPRFTGYRDGIVAELLSLPGDAVVVSAVCDGAIQLEQLGRARSLDRGQHALQQRGARSRQAEDEDRPRDRTCGSAGRSRALDVQPIDQRAQHSLPCELRSEPRELVGLSDRLEQQLDRCLEVARAEVTEIRHTPRFGAELIERG